ncbi:MAG TPA: hypothetical protein VJ830_00215 [Anaerolineales bacterium]|nr:hypothetical protein [Anaerolineales bacterium]
MWKAQINTLNQEVHKVSLFEYDKQLSYENVIRYWFDSAEFRNFYFSILEDAIFNAFFWENPPLTKSTIQQPYEFVLVDSPQLARVDADPAPFREKFASLPQRKEVITFENLGRDAELLVPCPIATRAIYTHFASFIRSAPETQKHNLFTTLANSLRNRINDRPTWVSTSGLGVYWLHIRLDSIPKYYSYPDYRHYAE